MKKTFRLIIAATAAITALASCAKDIATEEILNPQETEGQRVITIAYDAETKTSQDYDWHKVYFVEGDQIKVMDNSGTETCTIHITKGVASFSTSLTGDLTAVYPKECGYKSGRAQTITVSTYPPHFQDGTLASGHIASAQIPAGSTKAVFHNETALLRIIPPAGTSKITITSINESYDISDGVISSAGGVSKDAKKSVVVGDGTKWLGTCYVSIKPGTRISSLSFDTGLATKNVSSNVNTNAGVAYTISDENWVYPSALPAGRTFNSYMKLLAGSLRNITKIQFSRSVASSSGGTRIADRAYMSYADGVISVKTSDFRYTANADCSGMFSGCTNAVSIGGLQNINTSSTTMMGDMFYSCEKLETLDLSNFNTRNVKSMGYMFEWCSALKEVRLGENFVIPDDCNMDEALMGCKATWYGTSEEMESFVKKLTAGSDFFNGDLKFAIDMGDAGWWSAWNIGALKPVDYGDHYAWGETKTKSDYSWNTYSDNPSGDGKSFKKYNNDGGKTVLDPEDDVAHVKWGGKWRMPTDDEWTKLRTKCTCTWTANYKNTGVAGEIVTSSNGNYIFLPAAATRGSDYPTYAGESGDYWSSSLGTDSPLYAWYVGFYSEKKLYRGYYRYRYEGLSVRPVSE